MHYKSKHTVSYLDAGLDSALIEAETLGSGLHPDPAEDKTGLFPRTGQREMDAGNPGWEQLLLPHGYAMPYHNLPCVGP